MRETSDLGDRGVRWRRKDNVGKRILQYEEIRNQVIRALVFYLTFEIMQLKVL